MRSWHPIAPSELDNKRLLAEHNELLIIGKAIFGLTKGWHHHPEVKRWIGHSFALRERHDAIAAEMVRRGMNHRSPWPDYLVDVNDTKDYPIVWESEELMRIKLKEKQID